ncbi:MAG: D-alanine--D-alanine ligase A, partial [Firmicutes bacterium]|nr:D-alanine--D-alanine ligase A [Bacillota bacterium]
MSKKTIAVVFGGVSSEHDVSKVSAETVIKNLNPEKYTILPVYITKDGKWKFCDEQDIR